MLTLPSPSCRKTSVGAEASPAMRTYSMCNASPADAIVANRVVAAPNSDPEVFGAQLGLRRECLRRRIEGLAPLDQHDAAIRQARQHREILVDDDHRHA